MRDAYHCVFPRSSWYLTTTTSQTVKAALLKNKRDRMLVRGPGQDHNRRLENRNRTWSHSHMDIKVQYSKLGLVPTCSIVRPVAVHQFVLALFGTQQSVSARRYTLWNREVRGRQPCACHTILCRQLSTVVLFAGKLQQLTSMSVSSSNSVGPANIQFFNN